MELRLGHLKARVRRAPRPLIGKRDSVSPPQSKTTDRPVFKYSLQGNSGGSPPYRNHSGVHVRHVLRAFPAAVFEKTAGLARFALSESSRLRRISRPVRQRAELMKEKTPTEQSRSMPASLTTAELVALHRIDEALLQGGDLAAFLKACIQRGACVKARIRRARRSSSRSSTKRRDNTSG